MGAVGRFLRVQRGEGRTVGLFVALTFATFAGHTIGESGVSALFFDRIGADSLPLMYLAQGATGLAAMLALTGWFARFDRRRAYVALPFSIAAVVLAERAVLEADPQWIYPVLWLTVTVTMLAQAVYLWGTAGLVTDTRRAKRLFPLFAAGGILGAVVGGLVTRPLAGTIGAENLLLVWAVALGIGALLVGAVLDVRGTARAPRGDLRRRRTPALQDIGKALSFVRRSRLLVWMAVAAVLFSALFYLLYLPFAQAATARYADPEELAGFFGVFWAAVTAAAFVVSMLLTNRLLGRLGAAAMVVVLAILYAGTFGGLLVSASFATLVALRFGVNVWMQGVTSPAWETLVNVVPQTRRDQVRAFIHGGPTQTGTAIAGVVSLVGQEILTARQLSLIGLAVAAITVAVAWRIRRSYTGALVDALRAGRPSVFEGGVLEGSPVALDRDGQALGLALEASGDADPRVRRLAVEMLAGAADARVLDALVRRTTDDDAMVRVHAVRALARAGKDDLVEAALDDGDPAVRLAASVALLPGGARREAMDRLCGILSDDDPDTRAAGVRELAWAGPDDGVTLASPMLEDGSSAVRAEALRTIAPAAPQGAIPAALEALGSPDAALRDVALDVLADLDLRVHVPTLLGSAQGYGSMATSDHELAASIPPNGEAAELLREALVARGRSHARVALSALMLMSEDRVAMRAALDNLEGTEPGQLANALETLETSEQGALARPLLALWEPAGEPANARRIDWLAIAENDPDPLIRSCAELVRATKGRGGDMARSRTSMSPMERVLELRRIPLFGGMSPADLLRLAGIAEEQTYTDGEVLAAQGELGDELHVIVSGTVVVVRDGVNAPVARRGTGDVVGEMSIIT
ncbi:MAG: Npt1/Npt2 family nucleotide transporter, partial [Actinomycetota bacterium]